MSGESHAFPESTYIPITRPVSAERIYESKVRAERSGPLIAIGWQKANAIANVIVIKQHRREGAKPLRNTAWLRQLRSANEIKLTVLAGSDAASKRRFQRGEIALRRQFGIADCAIETVWSACG